MDRPRPAHKVLHPRITSAARHSLLLGTALASTLLLATVTAPTPAHAVVTCPPGTFPPPGPITLNPAGDSVNCVNVYDRNNAGDPVIDLVTTGAGQFITLNNSGDLTSPDDRGIRAYSQGLNSPVDVFNTGDIDSYRAGIYAKTRFGALDVFNAGHITGLYSGIQAATGTGGGPNSPLSLINTGDIDLQQGTAISASTYQAQSELSVVNTGALTGAEIGILANTDNDDSDIDVTNRGKISVTGNSTDPVFGINTFAYGANSSTTIDNTANIRATTSYGRGFGIYALSVDDDSAVTITNNAAISVDAKNGAYGIVGLTYGDNSPVKIDNTGDITVTSTVGGFEADGIDAITDDDDSAITVTNSGDIKATSRSFADGIDAESDGTNSSITVTNSGNLTIKATLGGAEGIDAGAFDDNSAVVVINDGRIHVDGYYANGIDAYSTDAGSPVSVTNRGDITAKAKQRTLGIYAGTYGDNSPITVNNSGDVNATSTQENAVAISAYTYGRNSPISINNSGSLYAKGAAADTGIAAYSYYANKTMITNTGEIGAASHVAIDVNGQGSATIFNAGLITGLVDLTEQNDRFFNQAGGVFETKKTSLFGGGDDLFVNQSGATVLAATNPNGREMSGFEGLETFKNAGGTISLVDGGVGDTFTIANTPGGADLKFEGGGYLAVDASLSGPGSSADNFIVDGDVTGQTKVMVNNTSTQPGIFNSQGIPVVFVEGKTPSAGNFVLADGPIDTGLFDYDLFFVPTGSGFWELRSFVGATAHALPKLLTAAQDIWHETSSTWFDRTADLRVVLNGGGAPAYDAGSKGLVEPSSNGLTPGVWIKGGGSRLDRQGNATTRAYGNTYNYDLDTELSTIDLQMGVDMGQYDVLSQGDVLIFGVLGGFVGAGLDYDSLGDNFDFSGGQVGAYATYLKGGLFVDTLLNVHLYEIDTPNLGFPDSLNATTVGLRTDAGYRFGSFTGGAFFEPLATIEVTWADIDGFNVGGNKVSFSDDANVRGRIGGRVGTTTEAWEGTMMEPFLIASLWGNLSEDNSATLVSSGTTFNFSDDLDDVWGELSAGVNLFNFSQTTAVFAKVDYTFGEDVQGLGGKAGVRVAW
ncbi:autotransporter domain-containing protein [Methyloceanibacter caenitepidi]|uniref:Autotransporter domain-containing protein n=1 Tax=Methyloceanibacter caenitepidi TaxID=1384459 RepID=A0A0A8K088_9HYPH|nr:autotransporter domain-containing protein [Methyloceanibacter caenitepidi]BAQ16363.1 hypothetical protein GL4_0903 [Methyloceanibacter caenitepidi]